MQSRYAVTTPGAWSLAAVEDAVEAIEALTTALGQISPDAARILAAVPAATTALRQRLLEPTAASEAEAAAVTARRGRRRGLGHGWKGVRVPT